MKCTERGEGVNDACSGTFGMVYDTLPVSGRFIGFHFSEEDEGCFREYVILFFNKKETFY